MSKYIVEIKPEYEDSFKGLMILGSKDNDIFVDALSVENLEELNSDYINEHFSDLQDTAYQRGLNDAWEAARKIALYAHEGGLLVEELHKIFGCCTLQQVFRKYSAQQTITKLKAYEEKQKSDEEIKVGDEVRHENGWTAVVISIDNVGLSAMDYNGEVASYCEISEFTKTGRHFDIDKILEAMKE